MCLAFLGKHGLKNLTSAQDYVDRELAMTTRMDHTTARKMMYCGCAI